MSGENPGAKENLDDEPSSGADKAPTAKSENQINEDLKKWMATTTENLTTAWKAQMAEIKEMMKPANNPPPNSPNSTPPSSKEAEADPEKTPTKTAKENETTPPKTQNEKPEKKRKVRFL